MMAPIFMLPKTMQMITAGSNSSYWLGSILIVARRKSNFRGAPPKRPPIKTDPPQTNRGTTSYAGKLKENSSDVLWSMNIGDQGKGNDELVVTTTGVRPTSD